MGGDQTGSESSSESYIRETQLMEANKAQFTWQNVGKEVGMIHTEAEVNVIGIKNRGVKIQINRQNF